MKKPSKVNLSIIILNYNTSDLLRQCLASIPKEPDYEVIVVDNASSDNSVAMVKANFPNAKIIQSQTNLGYTKGNNLAKGKVSGDYVLFLNSDTKLEKDTLPTMVDFMDTDPKIGIATCLTLLPSGQLYYASHRGFPTPWNSFCYFTGLAKLFPKSKLFAGYTASYLPVNTVHEIDACSGTFLLIRKPLLDEIGWFDEDYFSYGEDIELCYQVKNRGFKVMFNPKVSLTHYWGASSGLKSTSKNVSTATSENRLRWNNARYQAMKIFFDKHYKNRYPFFVPPLIYLAISLTNYLRRFTD